KATQPYLENRWIVLQYELGLADKARSVELPVVLAVKDVLRRDAVVGTVDCSYLAHSPPGRSPSYWMMTVLLCERGVALAIPVLHDDELFDGMGVVIQEAVERSLEKVLPAAARNHHRDISGGEWS